MTTRYPGKLWLGLALVAAPFLALIAVGGYEAIAWPSVLRDRTWVATAVALAAMLSGAVLVLSAFRDLGRGEAASDLGDNRMRLLVDAVADYAIYTLDPQGRVTDWNEGAQRLKGYSPAEIVGEHFSRFYTQQDRDAGMPQRALETARREGKFEAEGWRVRKDWTRFWADATVTPLYDRSGRHVGYAKVTHDMTERRAHEIALEQTRAALAQSQKMEALGQLTGGIAHDFNNLLHVILNAVALLERRLPDSAPDLRQYIEMVKRNASRAASLTQRMLAFARRQPLEPKPISVNDLIAGLDDLLRRSLGESIALETVLSAGTWDVSADANQLETALLNLAVNARDAMHGGGKLTIETTNAFLDEAYAAQHDEVTPGQYAMIAVSDTGVGMSADVIAKAFDPFFTTKGPGEGTGLGLSQVYGFIKQSRGHVNIYSEVGQGTTIKLYLPRYTGDGSVETPIEKRTFQESAAGETIVVVEDDQDVRAFTSDVLRDLGYRVVAAADGHAALQTLEGLADVRLLFTDVGLPNGMSGRELADRVRARWPALPILFTTAYTRNAIVHHGRLDPGVHLIVKPFTHATLAQKVREVLNEVPTS